MKALALAAALTLGLAAPAVANDYVATIDSSQEVPTNPSSASGSGSFTLVGNTLHYDISFSGLSAAESGAHVHGPANPGTNAGVVFGLPPGSPKQGSQLLTAQQVADLDAGLFYVNIHSQAYPGGEIRGQIVRAPVAVEEGSWGKVKALY